MKEERKYFITLIRCESKLEKSFLTKVYFHSFLSPAKHQRIFERRGWVLIRFQKTEISWKIFSFSLSLMESYALGATSASQALSRVYHCLSVNGCKSFTTWEQLSNLTPFSSNFHQLIGQAQKLITKIDF